MKHEPIIKDKEISHLVCPTDECKSEIFDYAGAEEGIDAFTCKGCGGTYLLTTIMKNNERYKTCRDV